MSDRIITGIDVGTYYTRVVITRLVNTGGKTMPEIIGTGFAESRGLKNGYIMQADEVARSIKSAVVQAEKSANTVIKKAYLAIGSIGMEETYSHGEIIPARTDSEISDIDLEKVIQDSEERIADHIPNRRILHSIPLHYTIDNQEVLGQPTGMRGNKLEVDSLFITSFEQHIDNLINTVEKTGIFIEDDVVASPLAASFVLLKKAHKRAGCILINIGSETTSLVVYEDTIPISLKVFPVGSNDITNDIALNLRVSLEEAEKIKRGSLTNVTFTKKRLDEIVNHRLQTIFELINDHLKKIKRDGLLPAGAFLTGGGANTQNIVEIAKNTLNLPARVANIEFTKHAKIKDTAWSVAYGLCFWGANTTEKESRVGIIKQTKTSLSSWLNQFLP